MLRGRRPQRAWVLGGSLPVVVPILSIGPAPPEALPMRGPPRSARGQSCLWWTGAVPVRRVSTGQSPPVPPQPRPPRPSTSAGPRAGLRLSAPAATPCRHRVRAGPEARPPAPPRGWSRLVRGAAGSLRARALIGYGSCAVARRPLPRTARGRGVHQLWWTAALSPSRVDAKYPPAQ